MNDKTEEANGLSHEGALNELARVWDMLHAERKVIKELKSELEIVPELLALLDLIDTQDDAALADGRFDILEKYGDVIFTGEGTSIKQ